MRETRSSRGIGRSARGPTKTPALEKKINKNEKKLETPKKNLVARGRRIAVDLPNKKAELKQLDNKNVGTSGDKSVHSGKESPQSSVTSDKASSQNSRSPRGRRKTPALEKKASKQKEKLETAIKNSVEKEGKIAVDPPNVKVVLKKLGDNMGGDKSVHSVEENAQSSVILNKTNTQNEHQVGNRHAVSSKTGLVENEKEQESKKDDFDLFEDEEVLRIIADLEEIFVDFPELIEASETKQLDDEKPSNVKPQKPCDVESEKKPSDVEPEKKPCVEPEKKPCDVEPEKKPSDVEPKKKPCNVELVKKPCDVEPEKKPFDAKPGKPSDVETGKHPGVESKKSSYVEPKRDVGPGKSSDIKPKKPDVEPEKPSGIDLEKPSDVQPKKPSDIEPEKPDVEHGKPPDCKLGKPSGVEPEKPSCVEPEKPSCIEPEKSSGVEPEKSSGVESGEPSDVKPKCNNSPYNETQYIVKSLENDKKEEKPLLAKEVGGLTKHGPYSRILCVGDSRMQSLEEFWPEYPFIKPQFLIAPHLRLEELEDFILSYSELPRLEKGTLLICNVGLYDIIELVDFANCASVRNHKPLKVMTLTEDKVEDLIHTVLIRLKKAYKKLEDILGSSSVICFSAIVPPDPITHFFAQARNHFPKGHTTMGGLLRDNLDRITSKIPDLLFLQGSNKHWFFEVQ
ncbi:proteoglycan 4-like [Macrobrachium nipponense]|uniref:proteoglycan 4-like n=1 Tax=Macrobrachium nipponense TaxID=159736 RepID=UPI0030C7D2E3